MKRWAALGAAAALVFCLAAPVFAAGEDDDLKVIKRAVKGGHACDPGKPMKWFRILVTDNESRTDIVKVNLPISLFKLLAHCSKDRHLHTGKADINVAAALRDLKNMSPIALLEIVDDGAKIKISLE